MAAGRPVTDARRSWRLPLLFALLALLTRLPFLLRGDAFFNSDEAVEGLMARHIREWPVFFWGQNYKGIPEVYVASAVFAVVGAGVVPLKAVTLGIWVLAVAVTTKVGQWWYGKIAGALTGAFLATGPPGLVYWSLCANAEVALLTLLIAAALLGHERATRTHDPRWNAVVFVCCGAALWIHPIAICAVVALALVAALRSRWWSDHGWRGLVRLACGRDLAGARRVAMVSVHVIVLVTAAIFLSGFLGWRIRFGFFTTAHPQKVFRIAVVLAGIAVGVHALRGAIVPRRRAVTALAWFGLGLLPVWLFIARGGVPGAAIANRRITDMPRLFNLLVRDALPVAIGLRDTYTTPVAPWWLTGAFVVALAVFVVSSCRRCWRAPARRACPPSQALAMFTALALLLMLLPGGMLLDVASYRYVMPFFGLAALSAAGGIQVIATRTRVGATVLAALALAGFLLGEYRWYGRLRPEVSDRQIIDCLDQHDLHAATADYWIAYRLTFLSDERLIVAPDASPDRYAPYDVAVREAPQRVHIDPATAAPPAGFRMICSSALLQASVAGR